MKIHIVGIKYDGNLKRVLDAVNGLIVIFADKFVVSTQELNPEEYGAWLEANKKSLGPRAANFTGSPAIWVEGGDFIGTQVTF